MLPSDYKIHPKFQFIFLRKKVRFMFTVTVISIFSKCFAEIQTLTHTIVQISINNTLVQIRKGLIKTFKITYL